MSHSGRSWLLVLAADRDEPNCGAISTLLGLTMRVFVICCLKVAAVALPNIRYCIGLVLVPPSVCDGPTRIVSI